MREMLATHKDLARKVEKHDKEIANLYEDLQKLLAPPPSSKRKIGYLQKWGLLPSEWVNWGESFLERLAGEEFGEFFSRGKSGQAFLRLYADDPSPL